MNQADDYRRGAADRTLAVRTRGDLVATLAPLDGRSWYVVTDPVTGEAFHFSAEEHALLIALKQPTSLRQLAQLIERQFPPQRASITELQQFVDRLYDLGLVVSDRPNQGAELLTRGRDRRRKQRWGRLAQIMAIRVARFPAAGAIDWTYGRIRWLCTPFAVAWALKLIIVAAVTTLAVAPELAGRMAEARQIFAPRYILVWFGAIATVKCLHELGHAMACRHFGCRPREAGVLLLAGAPALYCDVSDAWRLPSRKQRMVVSGAGMGVELVIAAVAVHVWALSPPGLVSTVCVSLVVVCSVGTLLVNANPLLRYDGYYLLADWLETPNLAERARGLVGGAWYGWLLGERPQRDSLVSGRKRRALWAYAILSKVYLAAVLVGAFVVFLKLARPRGLENIVYTVAAIVLVGMAAGPVIAAGRRLANPSVRSRMRWMRGGATLAVLLAAIAGVMCIPISRRVTAPVVAVPADARPLFATVAGTILESAEAGQRVAAGDVVAKLTNPELALTLAELDGKVHELTERVAQLRTLQATVPAAARMLPTAEGELADARAQLAEQQELADGLVLRAPVAGVLLTPPRQAAKSTTAVTLASWSGTPIDARNRGAWLEPGAAIAIIAPTDGKWLVWAGVDEADAPTVEPGQRVRVIFDQASTTIVEGRVLRTSQRSRLNDDAPSAGESALRPELGKEPYHVVEIELDPTTTPIQPGARGTAKIITAESTIGEAVMLQLRRALVRVF